MKSRLSILVAATLTALSGAAVADAYPSKPIVVVVPFSAGGPTDSVARQVSQSMSKTLGQSIIVENIGGAGGTLGMANVAKAEPDGYRLLVNHIGQATTPWLYKKTPYHASVSFEPVGLITDVPMMLVASTKFPANNAKELIEYVKKNPGKVNMGNAGIGSASHLCGMLFQQAYNVDLTTVPYKGTAPAMADLMGGQIDLMCDQTTNTTGPVQAGRIKAFVVTTPKRLPTMPNLPTAKEEGMLEPFSSIAIWHGLYAPSHTPKPIVEKLSAALQVALKDPGVVQRFADLGTAPVSLDRATPEAHRKFLEADIAKWGPVIQKAGIFAD
jgi:tripartite-type tricarboxylate transporter receptor subunit TctC